MLRFFENSLPVSAAFIIKLPLAALDQVTLLVRDGRAVVFIIAIEIETLFYRDFATVHKMMAFVIALILLQLHLSFIYRALNYYHP